MLLIFFDGRFLSQLFLPLLFIHPQCLNRRLALSEFIELIIYLCHCQFVICSEFYILLYCFSVLHCNLLVDEISLFKVSE